MLKVEGISWSEQVRRKDFMIAAVDVVEGKKDGSQRPR